LKIFINYYLNFARIFPTMQKRLAQYVLSWEVYWKKFRYPLFFMLFMSKTKISQMVKQRNTRTREKPFGKGFTLNRPKASIINAATVFTNFLDPN